MDEPEGVLSNGLAAEKLGKTRAEGGPVPNRLEVPDEVPQVQVSVGLLEQCLEARPRIDPFVGLDSRLDPLDLLRLEKRASARVLEDFPGLGRLSVFGRGLDPCQRQLRWRDGAAEAALLRVQVGEEVTRRFRHLGQDELGAQLLVVQPSEGRSLSEMVPGLLRVERDVEGARGGKEAQDALAIAHGLVHRTTGSRPRVRIWVSQAQPGQPGAGRLCLGWVELSPLLLGALEAGDGVSAVSIGSGPLDRIDAALEHDGPESKPAKFHGQQEGHPDHAVEEGQVRTVIP
ncbi:MAG TPA: hypothetical protein VMW75_14510 [Thermoanaerobaculia bacterium]|nr:hypothetical protein [Thermoanaerobaculia bacterium]